MKRLILLLLFLSGVPVCYTLQAQGGTWLWVNGSDTVRSLPVYGIKGIADVNNSPGALSEAATWIDKNGNLWLYGGVYETRTPIPDGSISQGFINLNDLWKYNTQNNTWTWMNGPGVGNLNGSYGIKGTEAANNFPPPVLNGYSCWTDKDENFWLYTDHTLWRYRIRTNQWTWINGDNDVHNWRPVYGNLSVPSATNTPGGRFAESVGWVDNKGDLWLYGGLGGTPASDFYSDIWRYNIASNQWTWMGGPQGFGTLGNYGELGIERPTNIPPPRYEFSCWTDWGNNFYIYGGTSNLSAHYNDVWRYNSETNLWTWVGGDSTITSPGRYGQYCEEGISNEPQNRIFGMTAATSARCLEFSYLFGGTNQFPSRTGINDLWAFYFSSSQWKWVSGSSGNNYLGNYGTKGVPAPSNQISARYAQCEWVDSTGTLWVYGGVGFDTVRLPHRNHYSPCCGIQTKNDLWKFIPDTSCLKITPCDYSIHTVDIFIPNAFSPNGDGVNEHFTVFGKQITEYEIKIFNRVGSLMYISEDASEVSDTTRGWDGTYKGKMQDVGVYVYFIRGKDAKGSVFNKKGDITLIR